jgi:predicted P-loop ATPase
VNNEFDRMWNETVELYFEALPWYLSGRDDYNQAIPPKRSSIKTVKIRTDIPY